MTEPKMADSYTQNMARAGRWFTWNFRVHPDPHENLPETTRVLAWPLKQGRWVVVPLSALSEGDRWLPLPGSPVPRNASQVRAQSDQAPEDPSVAGGAP